MVAAGLDARQCEVRVRKIRRLIFGIRRQAVDAILTGQLERVVFERRANRQLFSRREAEGGVKLPRSGIFPALPCCNRVRALHWGQDRYCLVRQDSDAQGP